VDFARETKIRHLANHYQGQILQVSYAADVMLEICLPADQSEQFQQQVINETAGAATFSTVDE
jgi:hypothetical protein